MLWPVFVIVFLAVVVAGNLQSARDQEARIACIQASLEWIDGDCRKEAK